MATAAATAVASSDGGGMPGGVSTGNYPMENIPNPHPHDVLCGRGGGTNNHIGNTHWRMLVAANKQLYISLPKRQKMLLSRSIVHAVRSQTPPGRFLQKDSRTDKWKDIGDQRAQEKTSQALREGAPDLRNKIQKPGETTDGQTTTSTDGSTSPRPKSPPPEDGGGAAAEEDETNSSHNQKAPPSSTATPQPAAESPTSSSGVVTAAAAAATSASSSSSSRARSKSPSAPSLSHSPTPPAVGATSHSPTPPATMPVPPQMAPIAATGPPNMQQNMQQNMPLNMPPNMQMNMPPNMQMNMPHMQQLAFQQQQQQQQQQMQYPYAAHQPQHPQQFPSYPPMAAMGPGGMMYPTGMPPPMQGGALPLMNEQGFPNPYNMPYNNMPPPQVPPGSIPNQRQQFAQYANAHSSQQQQQQQQQATRHDPRITKKQEDVQKSSNKAEEDENGDISSRSFEDRIDEIAPLPPDGGLDDAGGFSSFGSVSMVDADYRAGERFSLNSINLSEAEQKRLLEPAGTSFGTTMSYVRTIPEESSLRDTESYSRKNKQNKSEGDEQHAAAIAAGRSAAAEADGDGEVMPVPAAVDGGLEPVGISFGSTFSAIMEDQKLEPTGISFGSMMSFKPEPVDGGLDGVGLSFGSMSISEHVPLGPPTPSNPAPFPPAKKEAEEDCAPPPPALKGVMKSSHNLLECSDSESESDGEKELKKAQKSQHWENFKQTFEATKSGSGFSMIPPAPTGYESYNDDNNNIPGMNGGYYPQNILPMPPGNGEVNNTIRQQQQRLQELEKEKQQLQQQLASLNPSAMTRAASGDEMPPPPPAPPALKKHDSDEWDSNVEALYLSRGESLALDDFNE